MFIMETKEEEINYVPPAPKRKYKKRKKANPNNHGGVREGAGRKPSNEVSKVPLSLSVHPFTKQRFAEMRARGLNPTKVFEDTIENLANVLGIEVKIQ